MFNVEGRSHGACAPNIRVRCRLPRSPHTNVSVALSRYIFMRSRWASVTKLMQLTLFNRRERCLWTVWWNYLTVWLPWDNIIIWYWSVPRSRLSLGCPETTMSSGTLAYQNHACLRNASLNTKPLLSNLILLMSCQYNCPTSSVICISDAIILFCWYSTCLCVCRSIPRLSGLK